VIECAPAGSEAIENVAWPVLLRMTFPSNVLPSKKDTEPAGIVVLDGFVVTADVKVTVSPVPTGLGFAAIPVLVEIPGTAKK